MYTGANAARESYETMLQCKYRLPCGYCELKKEICAADIPITWTMPTEITYSEGKERMKNEAD